MIDDIRLDTLLQRSNQLPASKRLITWAIRCLVRDGHSETELQAELDGTAPENHWPALKPKIQEKDLLSLMGKIEAELNQEALLTLQASGFKVGQQVDIHPDL